MLGLQHVLTCEHFAFPQQTLTSAVDGNTEAGRGLAPESRKCAEVGIGGAEAEHCLILPPYVLHATGLAYCITMKKGAGAALWVVLPFYGKQDTLRSYFQSYRHGRDCCL